MRLINIYEVAENNIVAQNIFSAKGTLLVKEGAAITPKIINTLNANNILSIYVTDELTEKIKDEMNLHEAFDLQDVIDPHLRRSFNQTIKKRFDIFKKSKGLSRYSDEGLDLVNQITDIAQTIVGELTIKKDPLVTLTDIKHLDIYDYEHSVNTAVLSVLTGLSMGWSEADLIILAQGALLMNIGNELILEAIKSKTTPLTTDELNMLKKHPEIGRELLSDNTILNAHVKNIVLNHHERMDGSGYPKKLKGHQIDKYSKVIMISDVYDAMTSDRSYRKAFSPNEALEYIMGGSAFFDYKSALSFSRNIVPYPVGEFVALSNGDIGIVIGNNKHMPLRPIVRVLSGLHINALVDLSTNTKMVITRKAKQPY